jgi:hypothetical protein
MRILLKQKIMAIRLSYETIWSGIYFQIEKCAMTNDIFFKKIPLFQFYHYNKLEITFKIVEFPNELKHKHVIHKDITEL